MVIFHSSVSVYQRVKSHSIPLNHHFSMVFLWFSYGFPMVFLWIYYVSHNQMVYPMIFASGMVGWRWAARSRSRIGEALGVEIGAVPWENHCKVMGGTVHYMHEYIYIYIHTLCVYIYIHIYVYIYIYI